MIHDGKRLHLYIHIPFCRHRCDYCDFFTRTGVAEHRQNQVVQRTVTQAERVLQDYGNHDLHTIYLGGGTPSMLSPATQEIVLDFIRSQRRQELAQEVTVEVNPEDVSPTLLRSLASAGVTRLSVGFQSLQDTVLHTLGRHGSRHVNLRALRTLEQEWSGVGQWSADLITAVPGYTDSLIQQDIAELVTAGADHFSVYELTVHEPTVLGKQVKRHVFIPMSSDRSHAQLRHIRDTMEGHGYAWYEVSSYCRPGAEGKHNTGYWEMAPYAGCGPGAVGTLPLPYPTRITNTHDFFTFLKHPQWGVTHERLTPDEFMREYLMMGFRRAAGIDKERFAAVFNISLDACIPQTMERWKIAEVTTPGGGAWTLRDEQRYLLDQFLVDAFVELDRTFSPDSWAALS